MVSSGRAARRGRLAHICSAVPFEQPPAAEREQGVADEGDVIRGVEVGDVAQGVAAAVSITSNRVSPSSTTSPSVHRAVEGRDARHLGRADDGRAGGGLDLGVAAGVVGMPVGVEDEVQAPAGVLRRRQDRGGVGGVDAGGLAAGLVADEEAVVVGKAGELADSQGHGARRVWRRCCDASILYLERRSLKPFAAARDRVAARA